MLEAARDHWPPERELAAVQVELLHALLRVTLAAHGGKRIPPPLAVPRPGSSSSSTGRRKGRRLQPAELAQAFPRHARGVSDGR